MQKNQIRTPQYIVQKLPEIRIMFAINLERLRDEMGLPMHIVASHGDFVNRYLKLPNHVLLKDTKFRSKHGIELEVYDEGMMRLVTSRYSDTGYPDFRKPRSSHFSAIESGSKE